MAGFSVIIARPKSAAARGFIEGSYQMRDACGWFYLSLS
jgi:hypothetical protein